MRPHAISHLKNIHVNDAWETPPALLQTKCDSLGFKPYLDVAASAANAKCRMFIDEKVNAFTLDWAVSWFCNPPYSKVEKFIRHGIEQSRKHAVDGLLLTFAKTDVRWFHDLVWQKEGIEVDFIRSRVQFLRDGRVPMKMGRDGKLHRNSAPYGSMWIFVRGEL